MTSSGGTFRIGLLGRGTVGGAFAELLPRHAERVRLLTGLRPELSGVLTRSSGSFEEILERSDLIVELIGGIEPARDYLVRAMTAGNGGRLSSARSVLIFCPSTDTRNVSASISRLTRAGWCSGKPSNAPMFWSRTFGLGC